MTITHDDPFREYRLLSPGRVTELTSFSRTQMVLMARRGDFPKPVQLSKRRIGFLETEILAWLKDRRGQRSVPENWQTRGQPEASATA